MVLLHSSVMVVQEGADLLFPPALQLLLCLLSLVRKSVTTRALLFRI